MLPEQLNTIKVNLEKLNNLDENQRELLNELNFINKSIALKKDLEQNYIVEKMIFESFAVASNTCPACGKRK
ncbi:hypothetical protein [Chryseobacterium sp. JV274]|uniref:hypothetical protein n=1 Tax=Chryseobacterium sp. JV274 TaxID=1932669 RepID=UPI0015C26028|nr:hypothetical protein [Chryseobacterium sp. JV274]CAD0221304.1 conserved protein of unknown function [Chryseobacterium sp. JV274]